MALEILVLYYSRHGATRALAECVALGIDKADGAAARLRTVASLNNAADHAGAPLAQPADFEQCGGLALGSPARFGMMAAPLKHFLESTSGQWLAGALAGKPGAVFTSSSSLHGGQEAALLSMMLPLLHHGMLILGLPYSEPDLSTTRSGGTPYGASHLARADAAARVTDEEKRLAVALGLRLAQCALKLAR